MNAPFIDPKKTAQKRRSAKLRAALVRWHRRIGITAALFVLILSVTGIFLSHAEGFRLHENTLPPSIAGFLYDTQTQSKPVGVQTAGGWLVWIDGALYYNGELQAQATSTLNGIVETDDMLAVAGDNTILLYSREGGFIERLNDAVLPGVIHRIGKSESDIVLETSNGLFQTDPGFLEWTLLGSGGADIIWSAPTAALPQPVRQAALATHGTTDISMHRFMSDLHAGRTFGPLGPFIMDIAAILLIFLSLSGFYIWWRQRRAKIQNQRLMPPAE